MNDSNLSAAEKEHYAEIIRRMIEHENQLRNNRLTWFITVQSLLFAGLGLAWDSQPIGLIMIFCLLGIVVAVSAFFALRLNERAFVELHAWWEKELSDYLGPPKVGYYDGGGWSLERMLRPWEILPWVFISAWIAVFVLSLSPQ